MVGFACFLLCLLFHAFYTFVQQISVFSFCKFQNCDF